MWGKSVRRASIGYKEWTGLRVTFCAQASLMTANPTMFTSRARIKPRSRYVFGENYGQGSRTFLIISCTPSHTRTHTHARMHTHTGRVLYAHFGRRTRQRLRHRFQSADGECELGRWYVAIRAVADGLYVAHLSSWGFPLNPLPIQACTVPRPCTTRGMERHPIIYRMRSHHGWR